MANKVIEVVAAAYGVTVEQIKSKTQRHPVPEARKMAVYIMYNQGESCTNMAKAVNCTKSYICRIYTAIEPEIKIYKATKKKYDQILGTLARTEHNN